MSMNSDWAAVRAARQPVRKRRLQSSTSNLNIERVAAPGTRRETDIEYDKDGMMSTKETIVSAETDTPVVLKKPKLAPPAAKTLPRKTNEEMRQTETARIITDFRERETALALRVVAAEEADALIGLPCRCDSNKKRDMQCHDCFQYEPSCQECFLKAHTNSPFHWAMKWDEAAGYFVRHTLSALGQPLRLGHHGKACNATTDVYHFQVFAENGVHALKIHYCAHAENYLDKVGQLVDARLFPCTFKDPSSAITFNALRQFQLLHLESKVAAYDYCGALRRLSDNSFTEEVPDLYENFIRCSRMWGHLTTVKRMGNLHGLDEFLPSSSGSMLVKCPTCPRPGVNTDPKLENLPPHLRHLNQHDPNDTSLYDGAAHFPTKEKLEEHLATVAASPMRSEKSGCTYLKAVNNQDKKKFKNMEITGIVNIQCSHVFVKASVDLQVAERWANVDLALATAIRQARAEGYHGTKTFTFVDSAIDRVTSYDSGCQYWVHIVERFEKYFPDCVDVVGSMRWAVPALHIQGHKDDCMYEFSTAYMEAVGHFHGETAETYWPELNQLGPQVTRMSAGHRQDTIINHHNDWNYKKMAKSFYLIHADLKRADLLYRRHFDHFVGLCQTYAVRVLTEGWLDMSREPDKSDKKYVRSVYRRESAKVPSQKAVYEKMLESEAEVAGQKARRRDVAAFLGDGMRIREKQVEIRLLAKQLKDHRLVTLENEIAKKRTEVEAMIVGWRSVQRGLTPLVDGYLRQLPGCLVEEEKLGLPSDFTEAERGEYDVRSLAELEAGLREGEACDALQLVKSKAKVLVTMRDRKKKQDSGVRQNTRATLMIKEAEQKRDLHIALYNEARDALAKLRPDAEIDRQYPRLTVADTFMKSRSLRRQLGDSQRFDGSVWTLGSAASGARATNTATAAASAAGGAMTGRMGGNLVMQRRRPRTQRETSALPKAKARDAKHAPRNNGWLWTFKVGAMGEKELAEWNSEGKLLTAPSDRIQWFRAEAEANRWREQVECLLAEWLNTSRTFLAYSRAWTGVADARESEKSELERMKESEVDIGKLRDIERHVCELRGLVAYARQKAAMFTMREAKGRDDLGSLKVLGGKYAGILKQDFNLREFVEERRSQDDSVLEGIWAAHRSMVKASNERRGAEGEEGRENVREDDAEEDEDEDEEDEDEEEDEGAESDEEEDGKEEELATLLAA